MNNTTVASEKNAHASATASILHKSMQTAACKYNTREF